MDEIVELYEILGAERRMPRMPPMRRDLLFWKDEPKAYVHATDSVIVIKDKHPKAEMHFLVLPKKDIPSIKDVKAEDLDLLKVMDEVGRFIASKYGGGKKFWFGYHAFQLQQRLHLHVLSYDLCGPGMNTVWNWNSFTTPFFLKSEEVIAHLAKRGFVKLPTLRECLGWLNGPMLCHFCTCDPGDVYILKEHVREHFNGTDYFHLLPRKKKRATTPSCRSSSRVSSRLGLSPSAA
ncbi:aprataxin [Halyomorpha halys]|uniref:aprataxin n=1 Tax=Halyomorpha halys TaxID=286706 RepID=UPI0006D51C94|nr:aprataxin isoform X2 [Halyomorpha halys]